MAGRTLNDSDKRSIAEEFLKLIEKNNPQLGSQISSNRKEMIDNLIFVLDMKYPDLTTQSLTNPNELKQLTEAFSLSLSLDIKDPNTNKTLRNELKSIYEKHGLMKDGKLNFDKKLSPDEQKALRADLEKWCEKVLDTMQENKLLPSPKPGMEKQLAEVMADTLMRKVDQGLINLFGMDPSITGGMSFPVPSPGYNGLAFPDQDPYNGDAFINRANDAYDTHATGGDYTGANAQVEERYRSQADTIADALSGVLIESNYIDKTPNNTHNPLHTSLKIPGSE